MEQRLLALVRRAADMRSDAELLALVQDDRVAFAELIARHGPMVWGVCRHMLGHADAEDAFQATFVALLRSSIRDKAAVASWLHAVAVRVSLTVRRGTGRRRMRERTVASVEAISPQEPDDAADTMAVIHREIANLPEADRSAFVLCVVEGLTQAETATRLGRTPGTIAGQVARAKKRLVRQLTERGVLPGIAMIGTTAVADAVSPNLLERTLSLREGGIPPAVLRLAKGALGMSTIKIILAVAVAVCALVVSGLHLTAAHRDEPPVEKAEKPADVVPAEKSEGSRTWKGHIVQRGTAKPIAGAQVVVTISADEDKSKNQAKLMRKVTHKTGADGAYEFTITPEEAARWQLYIEVSITARDQTEYYGGYGYKLILKNEALGVRPFYERIALWPGRTIEGVVKTPEGKPAVGVKVMAYTSPNFGKYSNFGRSPETKTDTQGRFRLVVYAKERAVFWILPQDYAPEVHGVQKDQMGDLGTFTLSRGERLTGKLLDTQGRPVGGVYVEASMEKKASKNDVVPDNVANQICRVALTAADGSFEFRPLPTGSYRIEPTEEGWDPSTQQRRQDVVKKPLPAVFRSQKVTLRIGGTVAEIRALPHVVLEAQNLNSRGEKRSGGAITLSGELDGDLWYTSCDPTTDGVYRILVPKGLKDASISLIHDTDSAFQFRLTKGAPLQYKRNWDLGTIDQDMKGIEIIRFTAPIIVISVTTKEGKAIKDLFPSVDYSDPNYHGSKIIYKNQSRSDVPFENLSDGKIRTIQLVPDREVIVTVRAEGFKPASRKITLPEGKTEEMKFVLEAK